MSSSATDRPLQHNETGSAVEEKFGYHEEHLRAHMMCSNAIRGVMLHKQPRDLLLLDYYLGRGIHPDDATLPLSCWDETE